MRYSKMHYEDVARVLQEAYSMCAKDGEAASRPVDDVRVLFCDLFQRDNPQFNRARFRAACEPKEA